MTEQLQLIKTREYTEAQVRKWFEQWVKTARPLGEFSPPGAPGQAKLSKLFKEYLPDEFTAHMKTRRKRTARSGYHFERDCLKRLQACGWYAMKSAGSSGAADLIALKHDRMPVMVQCKTSKNGLTLKDRKELEEAAELGGAAPVFAYKGPKGKGIQWENILLGEPWSPVLNEGRLV